MRALSRNRLLFLVRFLAASALPLLGEREARADEAMGTVLEIQGEDLLLDLGQTTGVSEGARVQLWRPVRLKHPVTGRTITDRFLIGTLQIVQLRPTISLAQVVGTVTRTPAAGDVVIASGIPPAPAKKPDKPAKAASDSTYDIPAGNAPRAGDPDAAALAAMFEGLKGADPAARIDAYEKYVRASPSSRFVSVLNEEAQALRRITVAESKASDQKATGEASGKGDLLLAFTTPVGAVSGVPLGLGMQLRDDAAGAVVHLRVPKQPNYRAFPMTPMGRGYFSTVIPASALMGQRMEFFAEAATRAGETVAVVGTSTAPAELRFEPGLSDHEPAPVEKTVAVSTDFADYNRLIGNDYMLQVEGMVSLRYGDTGIRALRTGFGVYSGLGGNADELDGGFDPRPVGLTYGYLETEVGFSYGASLIGRALVGLGEGGMSGGGHAMLRIGNDKHTNLILGGELLGGIGARGIAQVELASFWTFPMLFRVEVTNQPAGADGRPDVESTQEDTEEGKGKSTGSGDVGARGVFQLGWRALDTLVLSVRASYQGRNIEHAGPGIGAAVSYQW
ncbi:hypothetical protein WME97_25450 [Sorangium sp. So ce367]|uniref:hypothetical protein n=1 Tax=Sorangium sp. So ce367 TaxID=3133305 RepID=UPI003F624101